MKRALLKQMTVEWKTNIWLILELAIVALAIWAVLSALWVQNKGIFQPRGFQPENVYTLSVRSINPKSPYFLQEYKESFYDDRDELVKRLRNNPNVAFVSVHNNMMPYNYDYMGNHITIEGLPDSVFFGGNFRIAEPDIIRILNIESETGKSQDALVAMLERGEALIARDERYEKKYGTTKNLIGKNVFVYGKEEYKMKVGDMIKEVRRSDYEAAKGGMILLPFGFDNQRYGDITLKVKPGKAEAFELDFKNDRSLSHLRNVYLSDLQKLTDLGDSLNLPIETNIRVNLAVSCFLLITIFLGLLGSFWFRIQQRVSEIAIRKTVGASNGDLFRRIIGEGLILLLIGLLLASACVWPFYKEIYEIFYEEWYSLLAIEGITAGVMAIGIILSLWYPAYRAMKIEPAIAVKEE